MTARFPLLAVAAACVAVLTVTLAMPVAAPAQEPEQQQRQLEDWEREELRTLVEVVSAALQGQLQPTERPFELNTDFLKAATFSSHSHRKRQISPSRQPVLTANSAILARCGGRFMNSFACSSQESG